MAGALRAALAAGVLAVGAVGVSATPAQAHARLLGTQPAAGAVVRTSPATVRLVFGENLQAGYDVVAVTAPNGQRVEAGPLHVHGAIATAPLPRLRAAGPYAVAFRIISADGHPVSGQFQFSYKPATPAPTTSPANRPGPASAVPDRARPKRVGFLSGPWVLAVIIGGVVVVGGVARLWWGRRKRA